MKKSIITAFVFFTSLGIHAQNQFSLAIDTTKTGSLGFNKKAKKLSLTSKKSSDLKYRTLVVQELIKFNNATANNASKWNMPVYESKSNHKMPVHKPDSTLSYSLKIVQPKNE
ncbi:hypothetical protein [Aurantibacter sp.]|uniref:hypothetical protein n=1 Tax=Aurantibacter sp. TaxID=2807103 RepID=UPI0032641661